jgi:endonuclease/exonuclease/phosphatase family metal-dependent hydrolase
MRAPAVAVALLLAGCTHTINLVHREGPAFHGTYAAARTPGPAPERLRVVSFNLRWGREVGAAIATLRQPSLAGADLIALQEMDSAGVDSIARALGLNYAFFPAARHPSVGFGYFGPAILTPWPIERSWKVILPGRSFSRRQQRTATGAIVLVGSTRVRVYSLHLEHPAQMFEESRRIQARAVLRDAEGWREPVIMAGDFNSRSTAGFVALHGWRWPTERIGPTVAGLFTFDHILACGVAPDSANRAGRADDPDNASDHLPVWADLIMAAPAAAPAASRAEVAGRC